MSFGNHLLGRSLCSYIKHVLGVNFAIISDWRVSLEEYLGGACVKMAARQGLRRHVGVGMLMLP